jgi:chemotaxis protein CheD
VATLPLPLPPAATAGKVHVLHPGDLVRAGRGDRLETLLGSCVAIILTDPRRTLGIMCHIVHARPAPPSAPGNCAFADVALDTMHGLLRGRGINPALCEAYVYGGGDMFPGLLQTARVGEANARWVMRALAADGIRVLSHDLGGHSYRRLAWTIGTGTPQVTSVAV